MRLKTNTFSFKLIAFYISLCLSVYVLALIYFIPAAWVYQQFMMDKLPKKLDIQNIKGRLWDGSLDVKYRNIPETKIQWSLTPLAVFDSAFTLKAKNNALDVTLSSDFEDLDARFNLTGSINVSFVTQQLKLVKNTSIEGDIELKTLQILPESPPYYIQSAKLTWTGGQVRVKNKNYQLPPLSASLVKKEQNMEGFLTETQTTKTLVHLVADNDKNIELELSQYFLTLTSQGHVSDNPDEYVVRLKQKLPF